MLVRKFLHAQGFRYRLHVKDLPGKPDIVLPKYKTVLFVHGCFWHQHENCRKVTLPKTRTDWWIRKLSRNKEIDLQTEYLLYSSGWNYIKLWECSLTEDSLNGVISRLISFIEKKLL